MVRIFTVVMSGAVLYTGPASLYMCPSAVAIAIIFGSFGIIAGYLKGVVDIVFSWVIDIMMAFPFTIFNLGGMPGNIPSKYDDLYRVPLIPGSSVFPGVTLNIGERTYIMAAKSIGSSRLRIMMKHILPNVLPQILSCSPWDGWRYPG